jgi:hypothetical protein
VDAWPAHLPLDAGGLRLCLSLGHLLPVAAR